MTMNAALGAASAPSARMSQRAAAPAPKGSAPGVHIARAIRPRLAALRGEHAAALCGGRPAACRRRDRIITQSGKWDWLPWVKEEEKIIVRQDADAHAGSHPFASRRSYIPNEARLARIRVTPSIWGR